MTIYGIDYFVVGNINNDACNYFAMTGHAYYAHQKKKKRFMRVKPCKFLCADNNNFSLISYKVIFYILLYN